MCAHRSSCPRADDAASHVVAAHPERGWSLPCDGAIVFDDTGELLPDGRVIAPHRAPADRFAAPADRLAVAA
ncbi:DUF5999 family protein [Streptomyces sp. YIM B13518]|uniref:DUF5999 family protein n=1 Tax=Streptomyces sp. YIM B13518 TaxID=3366316 RepID=UPI00369064E2